MNGKFAIRNKETEKWLQLDFNNGSEIIYVDKFTDSILLRNTEDAEIFLSEHSLEIKDHELNELKVFAKEVKW